MQDSSEAGLSARVDTARRREVAVSREDSGIDTDLLQCSPLHAAAAGGQITVIDLLLGAGANVLVALSAQSPTPYFAKPRKKSRGVPLPSIGTTHEVIGEVLPS